jgi:hypothetical protein
MALSSFRSGYKGTALSAALTVVHASGRLRLTRARASLSIEDDLNGSAARDVVTRMAYAGEGERIIVIARVPFGTPGATNNLRIATVSA